MKTTLAVLAVLVLIIFVVIPALPVLEAGAVIGLLAWNIHLRHQNKALSSRVPKYLR